MDNRELMKQMIDLHRASFENSFLTLTTLQKQTEKFVKALISYYPGMTDEEVDYVIENVSGVCRLWKR